MVTRTCRNNDTKSFFVLPACHELVIGGSINIFKLSTLKVPSINSATSRIQEFLGTLRIEPGAAGWAAVLCPPPPHDTKILMRFLSSNSVFCNNHVGILHRDGFVACDTETSWPGGSEVDSSLLFNFLFLSFVLVLLSFAVLPWSTKSFFPPHRFARPLAQGRSLTFYLDSIMAALTKPSVLETCGPCGRWTRH